MNHHKLIASLVAEIRSLRSSIDGYEFLEARLENKNRELRKKKDEAYNELDNERREQQFKDMDRHNLQEKLRRQEWKGDTHGAERTKKELYNL